MKTLILALVLFPTLSFAGNLWDIDNIRRDLEMGDARREMREMQDDMRWERQKRISEEYWRAILEEGGRGLDRPYNPYYR